MREDSIHNLPNTSSISEVYHENSKLRPSDSATFTWIHYVSSDFGIRNVISRPKPAFERPAFPEVPLPARDGVSREVETLFRRRRSTREFGGASVPVSRLSTILNLGAGTTRTQTSPDGVTWHLRAAPSGGGLFPLDLYVFVLRIDDVAPGLYCYNPFRRVLARIRELAPEDAARTLTEAAPGSLETFETCAFCVVLASTMRRISFKYGERGYRFMLLEAGHIGQNLLLLAEAEGLAAVPIGGFFDDILNKALGLNGVDDAVQYVIPVGSV